MTRSRLALSLLLAVVLVVAALLPNLTLAAFWLRQALALATDTDVGDEDDLEPLN